MIDGECETRGVSLIHNRERFWLVDPRDYEGQAATIASPARYRRRQ